MKTGAQPLAPAVVVGAELNGLGVVRSLARGGVQTVVLGSRWWHPAMLTRRGRPRLVDQLFGRSLVDDLLKLKQEIGVRPVLLLTDELAVDTISEHRNELGLHYQFRLPSCETVSTLANKASLHRFAEAHDLPVPHTTIIEHEDDVAAIARLATPLIIKPANKLPVHLGQIERVKLARTTKEAIEFCRLALQVAGSLVVQEWIDGPDLNICFSLFHCGRSPKSRNIFFGRKVVCDPPRIGHTAICVPATEEADTLRPLTEKFLDVSEYEGLGSLEFKWDPRNRRFVIIEPTVGRTDWQEEVATLNGLNLALIAYCYETGLSLPDGRSDGIAAWRESFLHIQRTSGLDMPTYDGYWRLDDPLPSLALGFDIAARSIRWLRKPAFKRG
jgi:D-aspartate ligase